MHICAELSPLDDAYVLMMAVSGIQIKYFWGASVPEEEEEVTSFQPHQAD
jgi:hypothetical protein